MEREKCRKGDPEVDVDHDGECDDDIEFEAIEADEEGHSVDTDCSGKTIIHLCGKNNNCDLRLM